MTKECRNTSLYNVNKSPVFFTHTCLYHNLKPVQFLQLVEPAKTFGGGKAIGLFVPSRSGTLVGTLYSLCVMAYAWGIPSKCLN